MTDADQGAGYRKATFAAGCFWGVEAAFRRMKGVLSTRVGYTGGQMKNPTYRDVCTDTTGHAEAVEVTYDPALLTYEQLLAEFFRIHDPTTPDRQGPDFGSQYRSAVFYHDDAQRAAAESAIMQAGEEWPLPATGCDPGCPCPGILRGRGVPPAVLREEQGCTVP